MSKDSRGRPPKSPHEVHVTAKLPRALVDRVDAFAAEEFYPRAEAIEKLLLRGLGKATEPVKARGGDHGRA